MSRVIDEDLVEPVVGALVGAIDAGDGGTDEQHGVLSAVVSGYWGRPDIDTRAVAPLDPVAAATAIATPGARRRTAKLMVVLEMCRHPLGDEQMERVERYATTLGHEGPGLELTRTLVRDGAARAIADFARFRDASRPAWSEPTLVDRYLRTLPEPDHELADRLRAMHDLPEGTLGREYVEFYRRHDFVLPGDDPYNPAFFVGHDMNHVIAGYGTTGQEETALSALLLAMTDSDDHWVLLLTSLSVYECGLSGAEVQGKVGVLDRPGAAALFAEAFERGAACTGDFSVIDHLALADVPLEEVRARFGVPPRLVPVP